MHRLVRITTLILACGLLVPAMAAAQSRDRNHDGLPDGWERAHHLSLKVNQAPRDQDRDGLDNKHEYADHTNPRSGDSDRDGTPDGLEDANHDGVANIVAQEQHPTITPKPDSGSGAGDGAGDGTPKGAGDGVPGAPAMPDHVVAFVSGGGAGGLLTLGAPDGTTATAYVGEHTLLACGAALPGPFQPCPVSVLVPGAKVAVGKHAVNDHGADVWTTVLMLAIVPPPALAPAPAPVPAPPATGYVQSYDGGVLTIHRPSGELPAGPLAGNVTVNCVTVAGGVVTSAVPCSPEHIAVGMQVALAQGAVVDGGFRWVKLYLLIPGS